jgi:hypothetical protein
MMEGVIHPVIMRLHGQWRGDRKKPKGKYLSGYRTITDKYWVERSYEYTHCGRNGVHFILTILGDEDELKVRVTREYSIRQYNKIKYCEVNTFLIRTEEEFNIEKVNEALAKKLVTKGVWYARKIDLVEYLGPGHPFYGHRYINEIKREDNYTSASITNFSLPNNSF